MTSAAVIGLTFFPPTYRNAAQRSLMTGAGPWGATLVRFRFGLPFSLVFVAVALLFLPVDPVVFGVAGWAMVSR